MSKKMVVFIDSGDTLIDESTEIRDENDIVIKADLIEGSEKLLKTLKESGYRVAMVADGYAQSFENMYNANGLKYCFEQLIYSSDVGEDKPSPKMFQAALDAMGLTKEDCKNIVMVGNNVARDMVGANKMGIIPVLIDWSPRYNMKPKNAAETPKYTIHEPLELLDLLEKLEQEA